MIDANASPWVARPAAGTFRANLLFLLVMLFLISPKVDLILIGSSAVRPEDIIFVVAFSVALIGTDWRAMRPPRFLRIYLLYIACCIVANIANFDQVGFIGFLFTARQLQYAMWFIIAVEMTRHLDFRTFQAGINLLAAALLLWWISEAIDLVPRIGKFTTVDYRISLNTTGPYELSVLVVMLMFFSSYFLLRLCLATILLATQARVTLVGVLCVYAINRPRRALFYGVLAILASYLYAIFGLDWLGFTRFGNSTSVNDIFSVLQRSFENSWTISSLDEYFDVTYFGVVDILYYDTDVSFEIRAVRWSFIIKALFADLRHFLFGWGPGAWGLAVDGNYIRVVGEAGVLGMLMFLWFIWTTIISKDAWPELRKSMILIAIVSVFIDIAVSSKVMTFFWIVAGMSSADTKRRAESVTPLSPLHIRHPLLALRQRIAPRDGGGERDGSGALRRTDRTPRKSPAPP